MWSFLIKGQIPTQPDLINLLPSTTQECDRIQTFYLRKRAIDVPHRHYPPLPSLHVFLLFLEQNNFFIKTLGKKNDCQECPIGLKVHYIFTRHTFSHVRSFIRCSLMFILFKKICGQHKMVKDFISPYISFVLHRQAFYCV